MTTLRTSEPESVRLAHAAAYRRLRRLMNVNKDNMTQAGWTLLTHAAFSLYVDSLNIDAITPVRAGALTHQA